MRRYAADCPARRRQHQHAAARSGSRGKGSGRARQLGAKVDQGGSSATPAGPVRDSYDALSSLARPDQRPPPPRGQGHERLPAYGRPTHADKSQRTGHYVAGASQQAPAGEGGERASSVCARGASFGSATRSASATVQSQRSDCDHHAATRTGRANCRQRSANGQPTVREGVQGVRWVKVVQGGGKAGCRARRIRDTSVAHVCQLVNSALKRLLYVIISQASLPLQQSAPRAGWGGARSE